ncbi:MAG TPA: hypothetical protein PKX25_08190, partial [Microthrixaceae bacterium]|nr:hypothetical protein [Microthrixaceae bacterium]
GTQADQYAGTVLTIEGFTSRESVLPGGKVDLHVSAAGGRPYRARGRSAGEAVPPHRRRGGSFGP